MHQQQKHLGLHVPLQGRLMPGCSSAGNRTPHIAINPKTQHTRGMTIVRLSATATARAVRSWRSC